MTSTFSTNKYLEEPANNDYIDDWNVPVNANWTAIDTCFGGTTTINVVGASGVTPLTLTQYRPPNIVLSGALTANVNYQFPANVGGFWSVANNTTGAYTVTFSSVGAGTTTVIAQGTRRAITCDTTNVIDFFSASGALTVGGLLTSSNVSLTGGSITGMTTVSGTSDGALKEDVRDLEEGLSLRLRPVRFKWKDSGRESIGFIYQEVETVAPELTHDRGIKSLEYDHVTALLTADMQALDRRLRALEGKT